MITTIAFDVNTRDDAVALANFQIAYLQLQAQQQGFTTEPIAPTPPAPTVETVTGPLTNEAPTSAPVIVRDAVAPTPDDVIAALRAFVADKSKGTVAARALLDKYKATRVTDVSEADLPAFYAELTS